MSTLQTVVNEILDARSSISSERSVLTAITGIDASGKGYFTEPTRDAHFAIFTGNPSTLPIWAEGHNSFIFWALLASRIGSSVCFQSNSASVDFYSGEQVLRSSFHKCSANHIASR